MHHNVTIVIPTLDKGGAELVASRLAGWMTSIGKQTHLITFNSSSNEWPVEANVRRYYINSENHNYSQYTESDTIKALQNLFVSLNATSIISFLTRMNLRVLRAAPPDTRVVVCERSYPPARNLPLEVTKSMKDLYPKAHALVVQTERCARQWADTFMPQKKTHIIPNPFFRRDQIHQPEPISGPYILAVGRLVPEKDFTCLLNAFAIALQHLHAIQLLIAGEGPLLATLKEQAAALGIANYVNFYGFCPNPEHLFKRAVCFALPSRYEGFPNVLLEAMWHGTPCVASDCTAGPRELLGNNERGLLFPPGDSNALANCLIKLCKNDLLQAHFSERAQEFTASFTEDYIFTRWLNIFA